MTKTLIWIATVSIVAVGFFIYVLLGDAQKTIPKIKLSYFVSETEIAESVEKRLSQDLQKAKNFWVGLEPEKPEQIEVALQLKNQFEKKTPFTVVIIDQELGLSKEWIEKFKATEVVALKNSLAQVAPLLADLEIKGTPYFLLTASIYSNPLIKKNQINQIKEQHPTVKPFTFSFGYFPLTQDQERNSIFKCSTDDHSGVSEWTCAVVNKARLIRRRYDDKIQKPWVGAMDLVGENDYMLILNKK